MSWYKENKISAEKSVGIDEVGRGPLAGPVVAAAVWISEKGLNTLNEGGIVVRDSKKMSRLQRVRALQWINTQPKSIIKYAIAEASVEEIDEVNILNAALLAMARAHESLISSLEVKNCIALIDGNKSPKNLNAITIIKGDDKVPAISIASIIAKEYRDNIMRQFAVQFPVYGWDTNVGYGTKQHIDAIKKFGITAHHRKSFAPIKDMIFVL